MKNKTICQRSILVFLIALISNPLLIKAQDYKKKYAEGSAFFNNAFYIQALPLLLSADSLDPDNDNNINYKIGVCYYNAPTHQEKAIPYLIKACSDISAKYSQTSLKETHAPADACLYLAKAYHIHYQFDSAIAYIHKFVALIDTVGDKQTEKEINKEIQECLVGKDLVTHSVKMTVTDLGDSINSPFPDYSPVLSADESQIFFTSRRIGDKDPTSGQFYENIYLANFVNGQWQQAHNIGAPINEKDKHDATVGLSPDGQTIFIYRDDGNGDGNIYTTHLNGNMWSTPQKLDENVDSKFWEPSASVSSDGQILYFSSNRPGGYGGLDIYMSRILPNGQWGKAINLGPKINTSEDDDAPYIHPDGKSLYFSSKGHATMGGFDIFVSALDSNNQWGEPVNIGYPVNTPGDDIFYFPTTDGKGAYYSSFKDGGIGEKDIYKITFPEKKAEAITVFRGLIISANDTVLPDNIEIIVTDNATGEQTGVYHPNTSTGKYLIILPCGKSYNIAYNLDNTLFHTEKIDVRDSTSYNVIDRAVDLQPLVIGQKIALKHKVTIPTANNSAVTKESKPQLQKLYDLMRAHKNLTLEVSGNTKGKGSEKDNVSASQAGAQSVVKYLVGMGIDSSRLKAKGYGSSSLAKNEAQSDSGTSIDFKVLTNNDSASYIAVKRKPEVGNSKFRANGKSTSVKNIFMTGEQTEDGLSTETKTQLQKLYNLMQSDKNLNVEISGYANGMGSDKANMAASQANAEAIVKYLVSLGIDSNRLKSKGYGSSMLVTKNGNKLSPTAGTQIEFRALPHPASNTGVNRNTTSAQANNGPTVGNSKLASNGKSNTIKNIFLSDGQTESDLTAESKVELQKIYDLMQADKSLNMEISGYANGGNEQENMAASQANAEAIVKYLVSMGIDSNRLKAKGYGSSMNPTKNGNKLSTTAGTQIEFRALPKNAAGNSASTANGQSASTSPVVGNSKLASVGGKSTTVKNIFMPTGQSATDLSPEAKAELQKIYGLMQNDKNLNVEISGYANGMGSDKANMAASQANAEAMVKYLVSMGIDSNRLKAKGYGSSMHTTKNGNKLSSTPGTQIEFRALPKSASGNSQVAKNKSKQGNGAGSETNSSNITDKATYDKTGMSKDFENIHFAIGKSEIVPKYYAELNKLYTMMSQSKDMTVEIMGHADSLGGDNINSPLSLDRAKAVMNYIVNKGIDHSRFTTKGFGSFIPVARNKNADGSWYWEGMKLNRRAEIKLSTGGASNTDGAQKTK